MVRTSLGVHKALDERANPGSLGNLCNICPADWFSSSKVSQATSETGELPNTYTFARGVPGSNHSELFFLLFFASSLVLFFSLLPSMVSNSTRKAYKVFLLHYSGRPLVY